MPRATSAAVDAASGRWPAIARTTSQRMIPVYMVNLAQAWGGGNLRFVTLQRESYTEPGVVFDDQAIGLRGAGFHDLIAVIAGGRDAMDRVLRWVEGAPSSERLDPAAVS